jgi:hypothetical protein
MRRDWPIENPKFESKTFEYSSYKIIEKSESELIRGLAGMVPVIVKENKPGTRSWKNVRLNVEEDELHAKGASSG